MRGARLGALLPFVTMANAVDGPLAQSATNNPSAEFGLENACPGPAVLTTPTGTITDGPGRYPPGLNCSWLITAHGMRVELTFDIVEIEWGFDILRVHAGTTSEAPLLTDLMGRSPSVTLSSPGAMYVWFATDMSIERGGFVATYSVADTVPMQAPVQAPLPTSAPPAPVAPTIAPIATYSVADSAPMLTLAPSPPVVATAECSYFGPVRLSASATIILATNYPANANCLWTLTAAHSPITISFVSFSTESGYDFLKVYAGTISRSAVATASPDRRPQPPTPGPHSQAPTQGMVSPSVANLLRSFTVSVHHVWACMDVASYVFMNALQGASASTVVVPSDRATLHFTSDSTVNQAGFIATATSGDGEAAVMWMDSRQQQMWTVPSALPSPSPSAAPTFNPVLGGLGTPTPSIHWCYDGCPPSCRCAWRGDGECDSACNMAACYFDNGDCTREDAQRLATSARVPTANLGTEPGALAPVLAPAIIDARCSGTLYDISAFRTSMVYQLIRHSSGTLVMTAASGIISDGMCVFAYACSITTREQFALQGQADIKPMLTVHG